MPAFPVADPHSARRLTLLPEECVDERGLAGAGRADEGHRHARGGVARDRVDTLAALRTREHDIDAEGDTPDGRQRVVGIGADVGLRQDDDGDRPALPSEREFTFDAPEVRLAVERMHDEHDVDVRRKYLPGRGRPRIAARERRGPRQDVLDDGGIVAIRVSQGQPVAGGGQIDRGQRIPAHARGKLGPLDTRGGRHQQTAAV